MPVPNGDDLHGKLRCPRGAELHGMRNVLRTEPFVSEYLCRKAQCIHDESKMQVSGIGNESEDRRLVKMHGLKQHGKRKRQVDLLHTP